MAWRDSKSLFVVVAVKNEKSLESDILALAAK